MYLILSYKYIHRALKVIPRISPQKKIYLAVWLASAERKNLISLVEEMRCLWRTNFPPGLPLEWPQNQGEVKGYAPFKMFKRAY